MPSILLSYQLGPMSNVIGDYIHIIHISSKARSSPVDSAIQLKDIVQPMEKPSRLSVRKVRSLQHFYQAMAHIPAHLWVQLLPTPHWRWHQCTRSILPLGPLNSWAETRRQVRLLETISVFHDLPTPQPMTQNPSINCQYLILPAVARALDNSRNLLPFEALLILRFQGDLFLTPCISSRRSWRSANVNFTGLWSSPDKGCGGTFFPSSSSWGILIPSLFLLLDLSDCSRNILSQ